MWDGPTRRFPNAQHRTPRPESRLRHRATHGRRVFVGTGPDDRVQGILGDALNSERSCRRQRGVVHGRGATDSDAQARDGHRLDLHDVLFAAERARQRSSACADVG